MKVCGGEPFVYVWCCVVVVRDDCTFILYLCVFAGCGLSPQVGWMLGGLKVSMVFGGR